MAAVGVTAEQEVTVVEAHEVFLPRALTLAASAGRTGPNADVVSDAYAAFARGDIAAVLARFDPDIIWSTPDSVRFGGTFSGPNGVATFFASLPENFAELAVTPDRYVEQGDTVIVLGTHIGRSHTGTAFEIPFVHTWRFRNERAVSFTESFDTVKLNAALGLVPQQGRAIPAAAQPVA